MYKSYNFAILSSKDKHAVSLAAGELQLGHCNLYTNSNSNVTCCCWTCWLSADNVWIISPEGWCGFCLQTIAGSHRERGHKNIILGIVKNPALLKDLWKNWHDSAKITKHHHLVGRNCRSCGNNLGCWRFWVVVEQPHSHATWRKHSILDSMSHRATVFAGGWESHQVVANTHEMQSRLLADAIYVPSQKVFTILRKKNISAVRNSKKINKKTPKNHQRWKRFTSCSRGIYVLDIACVSGSFLTDSDHQSYCSAHLKAGFWTSHEIRCVSKPRADYSPPVKVTANFPNSENLGISLFFLA